MKIYRLNIYIVTCVQWQLACSTNSISLAQVLKAIVCCRHSYYMALTIANIILDAGRAVWALMEKKVHRLQHLEIVFNKIVFGLGGHSAALTAIVNAVLILNQSSKYLQV